VIEIELDGRKVSCPEGSMVMHAAEAAGVYVPHFCWHKKLTIAANCRMCLVDVEKAPKPLPACATPVTQGMVVRTASERALKAQQGVMEFLLINHPLDCPICDQGGECQLQDLAVGYGASASRYAEEKRVVLEKDVGPLISMAEMSRCIHCTRCVRFGQEVAGVMELGMVHRGEHSEITTMVGATVDSELSGNMIDLCPVGALTSKPFRYSARTWELSRRKSVSPHDSTGANLVVQVKRDTVMRVLPLENEAVNECWISDRDRFAYEALSGPQRLRTPMVKQGGQWQAVAWNTALEVVANGLREITTAHGGDALGAIAHPMATNEELHLLQKLVRALGSPHIDHRLRAAAAPAPGGGVRWLGLPIAGLSSLDRAFVIGSFLRKDHPLFALRLRHAARHGAQVSSLHAAHDDWLLPVHRRLTVTPSAWADALAQVASAIAKAQGVAPPAPADAGDTAADIAASLLSGQRSALLLGHAAANHPQAGTLLALANWIGEHTGATVGFLGEGGNAVGAQLVGAVPGPGGLHAAAMLGAMAGATAGVKGHAPRRAMLLWHAEPLLDAADPARAAAALKAADLVVACTAFDDPAIREHASVLLPIAPFTETAGSFVNAEGRLQAFHGVVKPAGDTRPGWKVLRVLGNLLGLPGFEHDSAEAVRREAFGGASDFAARLSNATTAPAFDPAAAPPAAPRAGEGLERIADVPIHATDPIVRRSAPLQATADAAPPAVHLPAGEWARLRLAPGDAVLVHQGEGAVVLPAVRDEGVAEGAVRIAAGHPATLALGAGFGRVTVERVTAPA
jgi:NADH-quinone oxidoreductase subunit G